MKNALIALLVLVLVSFGLWAYQMFMAGVNPFVSNFIVIPSIIISLGGLVYLSNKINLKGHDQVAKLFGIGFVLFLILAFLSGALFGNTAIDIQMHDTYYVIANFHVLILFSLLYGFYAIAYFVTPRIIRRGLNKSLGKIHFWITTLGIIIFMVLTYNLGLARGRRYYNIEPIDVFSVVDDVNKVFVIIVLLVFLAQTIFLINVVYSLFKKPT